MISDLFNAFSDTSVKEVSDNAQLQEDKIH